MAKILLVEDDKSLREIYGVRLYAEGYDLVSAADGEEALAMAIKERPQLILSDVMMPKISGFDMLDILRSTTETRDIKVIMMTALSSEDQRARGVALGADRYLVKSQVGIEDVVRTVHEVLGDLETKQTHQAPTAEAPIQPATPQPIAPVPVPTPQITPTVPQKSAQPSNNLASRVIEPINDPYAQRDDFAQAMAEELNFPSTTSTTPAPQSPIAGPQPAPTPAVSAPSSPLPSPSPAPTTVPGSTPHTPTQPTTQNPGIAPPPPPPPAAPVF